MEWLIQREEPINKATPGKLFAAQNFVCYTLEDMIREKLNQPVSKWKIPGESAIPSGRYKFILEHSNRFSKKDFYKNLDKTVPKKLIEFIDGRVPTIKDVPGFLGIRGHAGNTHEDTEGCTLYGLTRAGSKIFLSRVAYVRVVMILAECEMKGMESWIEIKNPPNLILN